MKTKRDVRAGRRPRPPFPRQSQGRPGLEKRMRPRPRSEAAGYRPGGKLAGKTALITGGDSGIGRATAILFAREGADVAVVHLAEEREDAESTARAIRAEGRRVLLLPGDVRDPEFCRGAAQRTAEELGGLHVLVNNAAYQHSRERIEDISDEQWDRTFRTNIYGYFYMARACVPLMKRGAAIVNCGSVTAFRGSERLIDYSSTKGAIETFTKSLGRALLDRGIRVNCVAPGPVWTPLNVSDKGPAQIERYAEKAPMERPAQPEEIAPAFVFFASEADSSYITGETLGVLGGETV